jgi:hypothetical protein
LFERRHQGIVKVRDALFDPKGDTARGREMPRSPQQNDCDSDTNHESKYIIQGEVTLKTADRE